MHILFEGDEGYYKPVKITSAFDDNFIEWESQRDKSETLSLEEYLNNNKLLMIYLNDMVNNPKALGKWKIELSIAITFLSSEDTSTAVLCIQRVIMKLLKQWWVMKQMKLFKNSFVLFYKNVKKA